ncbi:MAG TPA: alpha/beta hydrolase [Bacteroidia bacterium]|nr:alpha/beta hydrolase [Bacteroidia bacterium]
MRPFLPLLIALAAGLPASALHLAADEKKAALEYRTLEDVPYRTEAEREKDAYMDERCRLDLYHPVGASGFATVVWFHGGGLRGGERHVPAELKGQGIAVVAVNYRLFPKVECPAYIDDAGAAVAWTFGHIAEYGGDPGSIVVAGHSAGGYLASMVGLDKRWLEKYGVDADRIAALFPYSGQAITHFTVREERGIPKEIPVVDEFAPLFHVRKDAPPLYLMTGGRETEIMGRYEENAYLWRMMQLVGHPATHLLEFDGFGHGDMVVPGHHILLKELGPLLKARKTAAGQ